MNMPIIVRLATKADLSNRSAAVALRDFEPLMTAVGQNRSFGDDGSMSGLPPKADIRLRRIQAAIDIRPLVLYGPRLVVFFARSLSAVPYGVRAEAGIRLTACHPNRGQATLTNISPNLPWPAGKSPGAVSGILSLLREYTCPCETPDMSRFEALFLRRSEL